MLLPWAKYCLLRHLQMSTNTLQKKQFNGESWRPNKVRGNGKITQAALFSEITGKVLVCSLTLALCTLTPKKGSG